MATIKFKRGTTGPTGLTLGEPAWDYVNDRLFIGITSSAIWVGAEITGGDVGIGSTLMVPTQSAVRTYVLANAGVAGVTSINGLTGPITFTGSQAIGITVNAATRTITINNTGVTSINGRTGPITISGSLFLDVNTTGQTITLANTGVTGVNGTTGPVIILGTEAIAIDTNQATETLTIRNTGVTSTNGLTGAITISGSGAITVTSGGKGITISHTGVTSLNGFTGGVTLAAGTGISISNSSGTITITSTASGGAGTKTIMRHIPLMSEPPATNFATIDTRNSVPVLEFDAATNESTVFTGIISEGIIMGSTLGVYLHFAGDTATGSTVAWGICMERMTGTFGFSADRFNEGVQVNQILPSTTAAITIAGAALPVPVGLTQGEAYRLLIRRIANDATNDTAPGDAQLIAVELRNT